MKRLEAIPKFVTLFQDYADAIDRPEYIDKMLKSLFTTFSYPDTILLVGFDENEEAIGFFWADPVDDYLYIREVYAPGIANKFYLRAKEICLEKGIFTMKGSVKPHLADKFIAIWGGKVTLSIIEVEL
jgi:hypothetical protein